MTVQRWNRGMNLLKLSMLVSRAEGKLRYHGTILGVVWVFAHPLSLFIVHGLVFSGPLGVHIENYWTYLLGGLLPWVFISNAVSMSAHSIVSNREIILSLCTDPIIHPMSKAIDCVVSYFVVFMPMVILFVLIHKISPWALINMWPPQALLILGSIALSVLCAVAQVFARDWAFVIDFLLRLGYLATPILYAENSIPAKYQNLVLLNPLYILIRPVRNSLLFSSGPVNYLSDSQNLNQLLMAFILCIVLWGIALFSYRKLRYSMAVQL